MKILPSSRSRLTLLTFLHFSLGYPAIAQSQYTVTDLGILPGFNSSAAGGLNASGQVAGWSRNTSGVEHAFVSTSGIGLQDLGTLGFQSSEAVAINAGGQTAGVLQNSRGPSHAFFWNGTGLTDIHVSSLASSSEGLGINASAQIVGNFVDFTGLSHAFLWSSDTGMSDFGPMPGMIESASRGVNDLGQVVGTSWNATDGRAFIWTSAAGFTDLGQLPGFIYALASAVNASGQVVGEASNDTGPIHGFLWTPDGMLIDLGTVPGFNYLQPFGINASTVVVGQMSNDPASARAFIWQGGVATDLNTLIPGDSGWVLKIATGINDSGQITGNGTLQGVARAFLLTPVP